MDAIVSAIITPVVESLMVPIKKALGLWISSPKHVKDMDAKMKQLKGLAQEVQDRRDTAVANTEMVPKSVEQWLKDFKEINEKADTIPTGAIGCFNVPKRYNAGRRSSEILKEIEDLVTRESNIKFTKEKIPLAKVPSTSQRPSTSAPALDGTQNSFASRDVLFNNALKSLQSDDENEKMIALCGTGGVGKTTLMEQLKKAVEDSKMFHWVVKVVVGENNDPIALQRAIAEYIREDLTETTKDARADRLRKRFEGMSQQGQKKILVIVDDIWKEIDLNDVGLTSPLPNGFKMLFTSRDKNLCYQMGVKTNSIFDVRVLDFVEAKTLFFGIVGSSILDGGDPEYKKIGEDIVNECGGLPIALKTIAIYLRNRIKDAWKEALSKLQHDDLEHLKGIVHKVFEISYDNLETEDDKAIFLLSGLFPDDFDIRTEDLMIYGWGLQLFTNVYTLAEARSRTNICVSNLIRANLLIESKREGCVNMHDLMRAFVLSNFSKVKQASIVNHDNKSGKPLTKDAKESYDRILLMGTGMSEVPLHFNYPNLSMLMLMNGHEGLKFPEDLYERMKNLEVISYEKMNIPLLPVKFEHSSKLRTLCLRSCSLVNDDICFLGSLSNLEILSFVGCEISWLPSTIGKLEKLKFLYVDTSVDLHIDDGVFQNLRHLEELYMVASLSSGIRFTHTNCEELENLSQHLFALEFEFYKNEVQPKNVSFKNLERFRISIGCELPYYYNEYPFSNRLHLVADCDMLLECKISELFEKTEDLSLQVNDMNHLENVSMHHSFSKLTVLGVYNCTELTYLFTAATASGLKKLEELTISECPKMTTLIGETSRDGVITFPKMNYMSLEDLPNMISLCENVIELPEMVELVIDGLPNFTSIFPNSNNSSEMQSLLSKEVVIPKLQRLEIRRMKNLKQLWPYQIIKEESYVSMLREIEVKKCDNLVNLFPSNPLPLLNHLEELTVEECDSIEVLFNMDFESASGMWECSGSRLRSITVEDLKKLKELWLIRGVNNSDILIDGFKGVESIRIERCPMFKNVFTPATIKFDLGALTEYTTDSTGEKINATLKGEISKMDEHIPNVTYPSYLLHRCHHLRHLKFQNDERVEGVVFEMDSHHPLLLPYLEVLNLIGLKEMRHVWKCNQNKFLIPQHHPLQFPFQNLTSIYINYCDQIKYLFSPFVAKHLSNLKSVTIDGCHGIEEVISSRDYRNEENTTSTSSHDQNTTLFPSLNTLQLHNLTCLKSIDDQSQRGQVLGSCVSLCQYPIKISINACPALSILIPWYAVGQMKRLQQLKIKYCETMVEIFESETSTNDVDDGGAHGGAGTRLTTPTLRNSPTVITPQLSSLTCVRIYRCDLLSYVFTFSNLESLKQLKVFSVKMCKEIKEIIKKENRTSLKEVVFPRLEKLELQDLPNLKGFFLGMNEFRWPLLDDVTIIDCPRLMMFTSAEAKTPKLKYMRTRLGKHSVECGLNFHGTISEYQTMFSTFSSSDPTVSKGMPWSFHNLVEINTRHKDVAKTIIPSNVYLQLEKLEKIDICECHHVEEVFELVALEGNESQTAIKIPIRTLTQMELKRVFDLKYLWKSNPWMVMEFPNLTTLSIEYCHRLEHIFTCSMVGSLVQLQNLEIAYCGDIKVIVKEEEKECDVKVNEIILLPHLESLKLKGLVNLKGFCLGKEAFSFQALNTLQILKCPAITSFTKGHLSTPELNVIDTSFGKYHIKPDLNSFIKSKQEQGYKF